ncbi:helix-turn-helix transcriptional regulator [Paenibacillus lentus]|uniref:YafY family transcriptional regulator n=1 Tax=Paenibacillus lentus TaxID=1338368 RepID=A0A3S8RZZ1_9BACL|nr:YafY family protein [Paenibacillus lentus]AZK48468.1 YafY family transcriptional regulator [Paenibacillus lentus]
MQINRLLEIVYILLAKRQVTAKQLAEQFGVSPRTIYRDVDTLSAAGIPVYTNKGKGGGIRLLDQYVLGKSLLSDKEQIDILSSLQGLNALNVPEVEPVLNKLAAIFNKNSTSWIDVDFSRWGSNYADQEKFNSLKTAILNRNVVTFDYYSSYGEKTERSMEPVKLIFKGQGWYIYGFCRLKDDYRLFKVTRIKNLTCSEETFTREIPRESWSDSDSLDVSHRTVRLVLKIESRMAYRVFDEFDQGSIAKNADGSFMVKVDYIEDEWVYGYILSYGNDAEVIEPEHVRNIIKRKLEASLRKYL